MSDLSELKEGVEAEKARLSQVLRDADGRHPGGPWFLLLALLVGLVCAAIFGPALPRLFGASGDVIGAAMIVAVSIVLTGILVAVAAALFLRIQSTSVVAAEAREAKAQIRRGLADAGAITALRARMPVRSPT